MSTHVVNVAFDFDDNKVREILELTAEKKVIDELKKDIWKVVATKNCYSYYKKENPSDDDYKDGLRTMVQNEIETFLEDYKDEIVQLASKQLADRVMKSKVLKEKIADEALKDGD